LALFATEKQKTYPRPQNSLEFSIREWYNERGIMNLKELSITNKEGHAMKPKILGIHHIAIKAEGLAAFERLLQFYHEILGLPVVRRWGEGESQGVMLDTGAGLLELFANAPDTLSAGALRHMALEVEDTDVCIEAVRAAGYKVTMEPTDIVIASDPPYPARIAFCVGPVGEEVEFFHVK
jgi:glyoxylase I family protein